MFCDGFQADDDIIKVDPTEMPLGHLQYNFVCSQNRCQLTFQYEWHFDKREQPMEAEKVGFFAVRFGVLELSVLTGTVNCRESVCTSQPLSLLVHMWQGSSAPHHRRVKQPIVDTETHFVVVLWKEHNKALSFRPCGFDDAFFHHRAELLTFVPVCFQYGLVLLLECWRRVLFQTDLVLGGADLSQNFVPQAQETG